MGALFPLLAAPPHLFVFNTCHFENWRERRNQFDTPSQECPSPPASSPAAEADINIFCTLEIRGGRSFFRRAASRWRWRRFLDSGLLAVETILARIKLVLLLVLKYSGIALLTSEPWQRGGIFIHQAASLWPFCLFLSIDKLLKWPGLDWELLQTGFLTQTCSI